MQNTSLARKVGIVGMAGAVLWAIVNVLEVSFDLFPPDGSGPLYVTNQVLAFLALTAIAAGILGIIWGGGVSGRFSKIAVWIFSIGHILIVVGGIMALLLRADDSPIFIVFPIGGLMMDVGALLTGIAVIKEKRWNGWQRLMPLIYAIYLWLVIEIPFIMGVYGDEGPVGMVEIIQDLGLFLLALAVYTTQAKMSAPQPSAIGQV
jgi:hypothetical protein